MLNNLGDGSTLSLDFTTGVLDPRLTFSRASGGTYVGNDGFVYGVDFATSSSLAIGTGSKSVTLTATAGQSRRYEIGQTVYIANGANNMSGAVTAYSSATQVLTINATSTSGSGSFTSWIVGNASARFDYDPTTTPPTPRGLLIEGSADNYMLQSSSLTGYSNSGMATVAAGSETDPTGTANSAIQIYATAGGTYHGFYRTITAGTNTQITVSIWAKARTYTHLFLSDGNSGRAAVRFNLSTGATDNNFGAGYVSAKTTQFPNNWWRCEMVVNVTASTAYGWTFVGVPSSGATLNAFGAQYTGTGNAADGIYCYGFQVEAGSGASSYIPTGASTGNRALDSCVITGTNFSSWFASATEGVLYTQFEKPRSQSGNVAHDFAAVGSRYNTGEGLILYVSNSTLLPTAILWATGGAVFGGGIATAIPSVTKHALKWFAGNDVTNYSNGVVGSTGNGTGTVTPAMLTIGANSASGTAATRDWLNACVRTVKFWPVALSDSQIIAITT
jgi:hypothetical protein